MNLPGIDSWLGLQYRLRSRLLGRLKLRPGLPDARALARSRTKGELQFYSLLLKTAFAGGGDFDAVVDVGSRNGSYLPALADFFPNAQIVANELDPGRRYWNLWRRGDFAEAQARALPRARFIPGDFRTAVNDSALPRAGKLGFIFFYPFVSHDPCRGWGLPRIFADFPALIGHARELSRQSSSKESWILSAHQGEWEATIAKGIYRSSGLSALETRIAPESFSELWPSPYEVFLFAARL